MKLNKHSRLNLFAGTTFIFSLALSTPAKAIDFASEAAYIVAAGWEVAWVTGPQAAYNTGAAFIANGAESVAIWTADAWVATVEASAAAAPALVGPAEEAATAALTTTAAAGEVAAASEMAAAGTAFGSTFAPAALPVVLIGGVAAIGLEIGDILWSGYDAVAAGSTVTEFAAATVEPYASAIGGVVDAASDAAMGAWMAVQDFVSN